jgi:hypothetical protein
MITEIIDLLHKDKFYGGGEFIEIAKGKNEMVTNWSGLKRKIKRLWQLKKK